VYFLAPKWGKFCKTQGKFNDSYFYNFKETHIGKIKYKYESLYILSTYMSDTGKFEKVLLDERVKI
jgi:hypothetical protein